MILVKIDYSTLRTPSRPDIHGFHEALQEAEKVAYAELHPTKYARLMQQEVERNTSVEPVENQDVFGEGVY